MLIGHEKLAETFKRLIQKGKLSHGYIFFGEPEVGKFSFARHLAAYLETDEFQEPLRTLSETLIIQPDEKGAIGITSAREAKYFLLQKPAYSSHRVVIVNEADKLTSHAQHALLKLAEEPPEAGLLLLVVFSPEALFATLQSRFQKIYFPRIQSSIITEFLSRQFKIPKARAAQVAKLSFGRPGRAIKLAGGRKQEAGSRSKKDLIEGFMDDGEAMTQYFTELVARLAKDPIQNHAELKAILKRLTLISDFNTNKRLQLESALWNI